VALALVSVLALGALAAALVLLTSRSALQRQLTSARAEAGRLGDELDRTTAARDELRAEVERLTATSAAATEGAARQRARADELSVLLEAATAESSTSDDDGLWNLLLAHVTRRWAAVVGVPPDGRTVLGGGPAEQLAQALARETERLREEVGVDVELNAPPSTPDGDAGSAGRVAVLVAALELLGVLATSAQRVTVDIGDELVLTGDGWVDPYGELAVAYERVAAAGVALDPLDVGDERVRLVVRHRPG
jgi:hypothetical protein